MFDENQYNKCTDEDEEEEEEELRTI